MAMHGMHGRERSKVERPELAKTYKNELESYINTAKHFYIHYIVIYCNLIYFYATNILCSCTDLGSGSMQ